MSVEYLKKIMEDIKKVPEEELPELYKTIHLLAAGLANGNKTGRRGSLHGLWNGSGIDDKLFTKARKSLFPYEKKDG